MIGISSTQSLPSEAIPQSSEISLPQVGHNSQIKQMIQFFPNEVSAQFNHVE